MRTKSRSILAAAVLAAVQALAACGAPGSVPANDATSAASPAAHASESSPQNHEANDPKPSPTSATASGTDSIATNDSSTSGEAARPTSSANDTTAPPITSTPGTSTPGTSSPDAQASSQVRVHDSGRPRAPKNPRVEYLVNPLGISERTPRFSWEVDDPRRGAVQSAYQVRVANDVSPDVAPDVVGVDRAALLADGKSYVWDSGRVASSETNQIEYAGSPLAARHLYTWAVRTFDAAGEASPWSTAATFGLGPIDESDWSAHWIGDTAQYMPPKPGRNGFHSRFAEKEDDYKWVQIDLGADKVFDGFRLYPARPFDRTPDTPGYLFPVRFKAWVSADPLFTSGFQLVDDVSYYDLKNPGAEPYEFHFLNTRYTMRYVRIGVFKMAKVDARGYAFTLAEMQVLNGQEIVSQGAKATASDSLENNEWSTSFLTDGETVSQAPENQEPLPARLFRRTISFGAPVKRAIAYASALGMYQLFINGQRIGDDALAPGWTDYLTRVDYQTYDVTSALKEGDNVVGAILGDGWYAGRIGLASQMAGFPIRGIYARKPRLLVEIDVELANGEKRTIATDAAWRSLGAGPVRSSDILDGEGYDARNEKDSWTTTAYFEHEWENVEVGSDSRPTIVSQACEPIRVVQELAPVKLTEPKPGQWVFDMGQNLVGWCRLKIRGPPNSLVRLRHAEVLADDGTLYTDNLRGAPQTDFYALRGGGLEIFEPHFTYHGFRYVEVTGLVAPPDLEDLTCKVVCTGAREVGRFECSDPTLTKLWQNIRWSLRGNLMSVPTDCPQRDERLGWMGDMNAFVETAVHEMDLAAFFTKWLQDVRDAQADDGRFPDFAPHPFDRNKRFTGTPAWGDAGVHVPWIAYTTYGDKRALEKSYPSVMRWIEHVRAANPDLVWKNSRGNDYGDWLNGGDLEHKGWSSEGCSVPKDVLATAFFERSAREAAGMADVLGRADDAKRMRELADGIRAAFVKAFVAADGTVQGDTQAGQVLALAFDLLPAEKRAAALAHLASDVGEKRGGHLTTGFQTTGLAMQELARHAETVELAGLIARATSFPSWGYAIAHGATSMWERRDAYVEGRGFQDASMNSFNHFAFGSVGEYLMGWIGGIQPDASAPSYARFAIHPRPSTGITSAHAEYDSIRGTIASAWKLEGDAFRLEATIPANTRAKVYLPTSDRESIRVDGRQLADASPHVSFVSLENGEALLDVHAGTYVFQCTRPRP